MKMIILKIHDTAKNEIKFLLVVFKTLEKMYFPRIWLSLQSFVLYLPRKCCWFRIANTGWPKSKFTFSIYSISETKRFWPHVGKAKMCLRGGGFFWKNCKQTAEKCKQIFENWINLPSLKRILALPT